MFAPSVVTSSYKKKTLKLNIRQINSQTKPTDKARKPASTWQDLVVPGDFYGASLRKGLYRQKMEDAYSVVKALGGVKTVDFFAVFDGHAGNRASLYAAEYLSNSILRPDADGLRQAFQTVDRDFCAMAKAEGLKDGTTATAAVVSQQDLYVASVGDSRALLVTDYDQQPMSTEHLASNLSERQRIEAAGGHVLTVGGCQRVQGTLVVSRSIGDPAFKDFLICEPSLFYHTVDCSDVALVLASDGLYAVMNDAEIAATVRSLQHYPMHAIADALAQKATDLGSRDNITVLVIDLRTVFARGCQAKKPMLLEAEYDEETTAFPLPTPKSKHSRGLFDF
mmetsp:Transcript_18800/g.34089  ORF Transcript_18800/g.34089 Transcript_18800/m.34089 type:complete len:337 (+) Transcript_18800:953-1963(+)